MDPTSFFYTWKSSFLTKHFIKETTLLPLCPLGKNLLTGYVYTYFELSVLFCYSICLDFFFLNQEHTIKITVYFCYKIRKCDAFNLAFLSQNHFGYSVGLLWFHIKFRIVFPTYIKNVIWILIGIILTLYIALVVWIF